MLKILVKVPVVVSNPKDTKSVHLKQGSILTYIPKPVFKEFSKWAIFKHRRGLIMIHPVALDNLIKTDVLGINNENN